MGNWIGKDNTENEQIMGTNGMGSINDNEEKLIEFCAINSLEIKQRAN